MTMRPRPFALNGGQERGNWQLETAQTRKRDSYTFHLWRATRPTPIRGLPPVLCSLRLTITMPALREPSLTESEVDRERVCSKRQKTAHREHAQPARERGAKVTKPMLQPLILSAFYHDQLQ
jgi:subtilisin-like proprotein convertase family protein